MSNYSKIIDSSGGRTQDLEIRSLTPYPLGQGAVRLYLHTSRHVGGKTTLIRAGGPKSRNRFAVNFSRTRGFSLSGPHLRPSARGRLETRQAREKRWGDRARARCLYAPFVRVCAFSTGEMCLRYDARGSRTVSAVSRQKFERPLPHRRSYLAARKEYDNAPYPMMATADAPSNAP